MTLTGKVLVDPAALIAAAAEVDAIANGLETMVNTHAPALQVAPAGHEEVSAMVSASHGGVADSFLAVAGSGVAELRAAANLLRQQAADFEERDLLNGAALNAIL